jgi:hypothetical protein
VEGYRIRPARASRLTLCAEPIFAEFSKCPVCGQQFDKPSDAEVVCHLGMCFEAATPSEAAQKFGVSSALWFVWVRCGADVCVWQ